jgi:hypothetical protein
LGSAVPHAVPPATNFDFGTVIQGVVVEHEFLLTNEGATPLQIVKVRMTSPLLVTSMPREIAPSTQGTIHLKLDTRPLEGGAFHGTILVTLNDPASSDVELSFTGQVIPAIELSPMPAFFVSAQRGQAQRASIEILNHDREPLHVEEVPHPSDRFTTSLETLKEGQRYRLTLALNPDGPGGKGSETILLTTSSKTQPVLKLPVNTYLHERVYTFPDELDLGALPISAIKRNPKFLDHIGQTLMIYQADGSDFRVQLSTDLRACRLTFERGPKGDRYQATVTLVGDELKVGPINGSIFVDTNDPQFPRLTVPVSGWILEH